MGSSRKSPLPNDDVSDSVEDAFERALEEILARVFASRTESEPRVAVAFSGGLDSSVLLRLAADWIAQRGLSLHAFHVHHGLSPQADRWVMHCSDVARIAGVRFAHRRIEVRAAGVGVEQAARAARYRALGQMCAEHEVELLLTAHHLDDQAETVLLQMLRGAGVAGLSGMEQASAPHALLGYDTTCVGRPLLGVARSELHEFAQRRSLPWVEDESNTNLHYTRNRLRHAVLPSLQQNFPGYQRMLSRSAQHAADAQELLDELGDADLRECRQGDIPDAGLDVAYLLTLSPARFNNLVRRWFATCNLRMPSTAWLAQLRKQVMEAGEGAAVRVTHPDCELWRYRGRLLLAPRVAQAVMEAVPINFRWQGERELQFKEFGGTLVFEPAENGVQREWLEKQQMILRHRSGGERLKLAPNRPMRTLKQHFQTLALPPWQRTRLPVVAVGSTVLFAAGIGMNAGVPTYGSGNCMLLRWQADA